MHLAKIAFEKYFLHKVHKVRHGSSEPGYERIVMKALGIERLRAGGSVPRLCLRLHRIRVNASGM